ncbi:SseB family protein [Streptomyces sp. XD-27]|uniref:SseB family protein n=1 Tax=Streptomyces sp. XD-27 TaxID=3062779 RepID=UPI0026F45C89|nr:SseB family protein [Streptomyces sp. XD-27]WKX70182.1 SseB family protein [Streptomyces sp. XD-27]
MTGGRLTLAECVRREAVASMSDAEKATALRGLRLYFERPEEPGFLVSETEIGRLVPVFTSVEGLAKFAGVCGWASTTAEDLVELLPDGVRALVDPYGEQPFLLDTDVLSEVPGGSSDGGA